MGNAVLPYNICSDEHQPAGSGLQEKKKYRNMIMMT